MYPHNHHHKQLLERVRWREAPVHRQHLAVRRIEVSPQLTGHVGGKYVVDQHGGRQQPEQQLHHVGPAHRKRAARRNGIQTEQRMHRRSQRQQRRARHSAPGAQQRRAPGLHRRQRMQAQRQVGQVADDKRHQHQARYQAHVA